MHDAARARVFGSVAEQYERARPGYPPALIDEVTARARGGRVVEVGAGTGKATRLLAPHVAELTAVEPDPAMATVLARTCARWPQVRIERSSFEAWAPPAPATFDLVTSAQAWHWVDVDVAVAKAVLALRPGGWLAPFWNRAQYDENPLRGTFDEIYARLAPEMDDSVTAGSSKPLADRVGVDVHVERLRQSGAFARVEERRYDWIETRTAAQYVDLMGTHSNHLLLEPDRRAVLHAAIANAIEASGGSVTIPHRAYLVLAQTPA